MKKVIFDLDVQKLNIGLLVVRVLIGITFVIHGMPKLFGGIDTWNFVGSLIPDKLKLLPRIVTNDL